VRTELQFDEAHIPSAVCITALRAGFGSKLAWLADPEQRVVIVGGDGLWNCHVHTNDIGASIEAGIAAGRPDKIRVTDLLVEHFGDYVDVAFTARMEEELDEIARGVCMLS